jgi:hypothetical protein
MHRRHLSLLLAAILTVTAAVVGTAGIGSAQRDADPIWSPLSERAQADLLDDADDLGALQPQSFTAATLRQDLLDELLAPARAGRGTTAANVPTVVTIPSPTGDMRSFEVVEATAFEPALAEKYPELAAYVGTATDGSGDTVRFESTPSGFRAQVASTSGWWYVDPRVHTDTSVYLSYFRSDLPITARPAPGTLLLDPTDLIGTVDSSGTGTVDSTEAPDLAERPGLDDVAASDLHARSNGTRQRTYRLAVSADSTYSTFHGGTVPNVLAAYATLVNRLNGIYGPELAIQFVLVDDTDQLIYLNDGGCPGGGSWSTPTPGPNCDPFGSSNGQNLDRNQVVTDAVIGTANYDVGHVVVGLDCGLAATPAVGSPSFKAQGCSGLSVGFGGPIGDPFVVDYVAHELGHQYGALHTFNSQVCGSNRNSPAAFEVGGGTTILAYAGICGNDDVQIIGTATGATGASDPYFHSFSLDQIITYTTSPGSPGNLGAANSGNSVPVAVAGPDGAIPASTPFRLTGRGTDADAATVLRHNWEQRDLAPSSRTLGNPDVAAGALFRSRPPSTDPNRYLPTLQALADQTSNLDGPCPAPNNFDAATQQCWAEFVPNVERSLNFRLTVRDGHPTSGGVNHDDLVVQVVDTGAPFAVTSPNTAVSLPGGSTQTVTWNPAGTNAAPISAANVNIRASLDNGITYPYVLATSTPNDGSHSVTLPGVAADTQARIMVEKAGTACGVFFFDVSDVAFTLTAGGTPTAPPAAVACDSPAPPPPDPDPDPDPDIDPPAGTNAFTTLAPGRFVDTRPSGTTIDGQFERAGVRGADTQYRVDIAGRGGVPSGAKAAIMNVTAVGANGTGFVTVHPCVSPRPVASSLNFTAGVNLGNEIVAPLTASGEVCLYTSRATQLTVDVTGFVAADSPTVPVTPARFLDTRPNGFTFDGQSEGGAKPQAGDTEFLTVAGRGSVPADAAAVIVNVTAVAAERTGFVTVDPCGAEIPVASSLNFVAGVNRGNEIIASVDSEGDICLFVSANVHLTADVVGFLPAGTDLTPVEPGRILDTRLNGSTVDGAFVGDDKRAPGSQFVLQVTGRGGVPVDATSAVINVTAVGAEGNGFVTVHPCITPRPVASSLNHVAGVNGGNEIIARLSATGTICLFTSARTHLTVDVVAAIS